MADTGEANSDPSDFALGLDSPGLRLLGAVKTIVDHEAGVIEIEDMAGTADIASQELRQEVSTTRTQIKDARERQQRLDEICQTDTPADQIANRLGLRRDEYAALGQEADQATGLAPVDSKGRDRIVIAGLSILAVGGSMLLGYLRGRGKN